MAATVDTPPAVERLLIEGYRRMDPAEKLRRVEDMNRALRQLAAARLHAQYGPMPDSELQLRLAALRLDAATMRDTFGWDPDVRGR